MPKQKHDLSPSVSHRSTKPAQAVEAAPQTQTQTQTSSIITLQQTIGNYAVQQLLAQNHPMVAAKVQPKLHVGAAHDSFEQEADTVASAVMNMPDAALQREDDGSQAQGSDIQRAEENEELQMKRIEIQRASVDMMGEFDVEGSVEQGIQQSAGSGQPLADSARSFFEPRFGHGFDNVHVHADSTADSLNRSIQARAFTRGSDIYFASGEYQPESSDGRTLLAHELTHVIQQTGGSPKRK